MSRSVKAASNGSTQRSDHAEGDRERPRKRQKISPQPHSAYSPSFQQIILEEIDLEVAIRQRIAHTVQSRLTWALLLQESLDRNAGSRSDEFRTASLDALDAIEAPCDLLFNRDIRLAPQPLHRPASIPPPPTLPSTELSSLPLPNLPSRSTRTRGPPRAAPAPRERLLYIRNTATDPPEVAKLACHVCARSDFSSLQGLLNHCRLRHQIEYGSHDECMQSCAVLVPQHERDWVVACGIEVGGVSLPSLRRLFEIAVGAGEGLALPTRRPSPAVAPKPEAALEEPSASTETAKVHEQAPKEISQSSAHVTKTLGYHADTPALAPFLGRVPKKRCINVRANEDEVVDIGDTSGGSGLHARHVWRKPYAHRNIARKELDEIVPLSTLPDNVPAEDRAPESKSRPEETDGKASSALQMLSGTRFHINARVKVADHSLFLPPNHRPTQRADHTHRWRLTVTSPPYSLPISSILRTLTVACATDQPPATLVEPIVVSKPPFIVTGTAEKPFLARLTFTWAGTMNPPTEIEHWVELDPMHYLNPVEGDEQMFDVELDRSTELLPVPADDQEPSLEDMHDADTAPDAREAAQAEEEVELEYAIKLRTLVPQFPMTLKDVKGRFSTRLPYTLANSPAQLQSLHYGRQKSIEMARARALRDAYTRLSEQSPGTDLIPLTTVDVFRWLEDEGFYPRASPTASLSESQKLARSSRRQRGAGAGAHDGTAFCRTCGLHRTYHPNVADEDTKPVDIKPAMLGAALERGLCMSFAGTGADAEPTRAPIFDVHSLLKFAPTSAEEPAPYGLGRAIFVAPPQSGAQAETPLGSPATDLVSVADPALVVAIQRLTSLPRRRRSAPALGHDDDVPVVAPALGSISTMARSAAAAHLAPSALLAVVLKPLVRQLVGRGVDTLRQDEAALRVGTGRHERARRATTAVVEGPRRVLAPSHVLRGVAGVARTGTSATGGALRVCLARLGERCAPLSQGGDPIDGAFHIWSGASSHRYF
ncbi:uncharacterized protein TRAVEDRAFT_71391 [Trametes versicolor FP-101664 SS1]|uniref:uncharacterized protein n=1 Tax=Trametes versicolor (strain FP-101664) TaxID=717944 RepID=UPI0004621649|nr:uncharacterized protein TRAVEDRAFT_71391 [Trametes versicolor FP-101664 SS1]EIW59252.1 hypothetical protein TRAVEDRAFT_71391 [Trametes versicolor FP-101664 SS1]